MAPELVLLVWEVIHPVLIRHILLLQGSLFSFFFLIQCVHTFAKNCSWHSSSSCTPSVLEEEKADIVFTHTICIVKDGGSVLLPINVALGLDL